ncbi:MAG: histidine triad (HIT) protein [Epulopiscium sp. Nele67-Bin005]|nr:MAG: histidine triad (HIT) protein [Epulopiscium sp. Nele67-Bin005]
MCIFCKILNKEIPSTQVYEDDLFVVIMDIFPISRGHMLIVPKEHCENIFDLPEHIAKNIYPLAKKLSICVSKALGTDGINILQNNGEIAGQEVFHFHLHIIPRYKDEDIQISKPTRLKLEASEIEEIAQKIKNVI